MNLTHRFKVWYAGIRDFKDWVAYRLTYPITDYITDNTDYGGVLGRAGIDDNSRMYVSRTLLHALFLWVLLTIASNILLIPWEWVEAIAGVAESVLVTTNIALVITSFFQGIWESIVAIITESPEMDTESLFEGIEERLRSIGEEITVIGAILLTIFTVFESVLEPLIIEAQNIIGQIDIEADTSGSGGLEEIAVRIEDALPSAEFIRNLISAILAPLAALGFAAGKLYWPYYLGNERSRTIKANLARSYTFMYALSEGGLDIYDIMKELADSEDAYGEVSVTFKKIIRRANRGEMNLSGAIVQTAEETPNEELEDFLNGLVNSLDTGSDVTQYLENAADNAFREAQESQSNRLELYEIISEGYVIMFVAAPIFFLILQLVSGIAGTVDRGATQFIPYMLIPAGGFMIAAILYMAGGSSGQKFRELELPSESRWYDIEEYTDVTGNFDRKIHQTSDQFKKAKARAIRPLAEIRHTPKYTLLITVPTAMFYLAAVIQLQIVPLDIELLDEQYLQVTIFGYYIPFLLITVPWMVLYEAKRRRRERTLRQLPQLFSAISESNKRGLTLQESIETAAMTNNSTLYNQLQRAVRTSKVTNSLERALIEFANHSRVPRLSQAVRLLVKANTVSSNVTIVVQTIADDLKSMYELKRERKQRARIYVVIMFVAFLISAGVLIALDATFFEFITEEVETDGDESDSAAEAEGYGQDIPIAFFQRVFLHTLLSLSLVSGLVAGLMENNQPANGLKYAIAMTTLAIMGMAIVPAL